MATKFPLGKDFYSNLAPEKYLELGINNECGTAQQILNFLGGINIFHPKTMVELGCGPGKSLSCFTSLEIFENYIVADVSEKMCVYAENTWKDKGLNIKSCICDLEKDTLQIPKSSVDLVICTSTIHYLSDLKNIFSETFRILKRGGLFAFTLIVNSDNQEVESFIYPNYLRVQCYSHPRARIHAEMNRGFYIEKSEILKKSIFMYEGKQANHEAYLFRKIKG